MHIFKFGEFLKMANVIVSPNHDAPNVNMLASAVERKIFNENKYLN